jgi:hypothetical protein
MRFDTFSVRSFDTFRYAEHTGRTENTGETTGHLTKLHKTAAKSLLITANGLHRRGLKMIFDTQGVP